MCIANILENLLHKRFQHISNIIFQIECLLSEYDIDYKFVTLENGKGDIVVDNYMIGYIDLGNEEYIDFQVYYITDNLKQFYITETEILETNL